MDCSNAVDCVTLSVSVIQYVKLQAEPLCANAADCMLQSRCSSNVCTAVPDNANCTDVGERSAFAVIMITGPHCFACAVM